MVLALDLCYFAVMDGHPTIPHPDCVAVGVVVRRGISAIGHGKRGTRRWSYCLSGCLEPNDRLG